MRANGLMFPQSIDSPTVVAGAAALHAALIVNADPSRLPTLLRAALVYPEIVVFSVVLLVCLGGLASLVSRRSGLLIRRGTIVLIALVVAGLAMELLGVLKAGGEPWRSIVWGSTAVISIGGIASLITAIRRRSPLDAMEEP